MLKKHQIKKIIKQMVPSSVYSNPQRKMLRETAKTELYDYITKYDSLKCLADINNGNICININIEGEFTDQNGTFILNDNINSILEEYLLLNVLND